MMLGNLRVIFLGVAIAFLVYKAQDIILPWGKPVISTKGHGEYAPVDYTEDSLMFKHGRTKKIIGCRNMADLIQGPETVIVNPLEEDKLYLLTEEGFLISVTDMVEGSGSSPLIHGTVNFLKDLGNGRSLAGSFAQNGKTLYIADSVLGLLRIQDIQDDCSKVEVIASAVVDKETGQLSKLRYVDDLCIGPKTQKVYFTDATEICPNTIGRKAPDTLYSSKVDFIRCIPMGQLLEYDPQTDEVRILAKGIHFANGV